MSKKNARKPMLVAEAIVWMLFVLSAGLGSLSQLKMVALTTQAQTAVGYLLGGFAGLVFTYLVYKAVENRA